MRSVSGGSVWSPRAMPPREASYDWVTGRTKTEAKTKLREAQQARDAGLPAGRRNYTVRQAVDSWLEHGLAGRDRSTVTNRTILARRYVLPALGSRRLTELTADEVDRWLVGKSSQLSTDTLAKLLSILRQSIRRAQARDLVQRNVALLCEAPKGTGGRPSKSLSLEQAKSTSARRRGYGDACVHRGLTSHRCAYGGTESSHLESPGLGR